MESAIFVHRHSGDELSKCRDQSDSDETTAHSATRRNSLAHFDPRSDPTNNNNNNNNSLTAVPSFLSEVSLEALGLWREGRGHYYLAGPNCGCGRLLRWNSIIPTFMQVSRKTTENLDQDYRARGMPTPRTRCVLQHWCHTSTQAREVSHPNNPALKFPSDRHD